VVEFCVATCGRVGVKLERVVVGIVDVVAGSDAFGVCVVDGAKGESTDDKGGVKLERVVKGVDDDVFGSDVFGVKF
jgi:hypothetical protein